MGHIAAIEAAHMLLGFAGSALPGIAGQGWAN
jgi:hypothetical protein